MKETRPPTRPKADLIPPQVGFPSLKPFNSEEYSGGLEKRPNYEQRPVEVEQQNLRPKRKPSAFDFDEFSDSEFGGNFGFTRAPIEKRPIEIKQENVIRPEVPFRPKRRPSAFDFDEFSRPASPVRFNSVDDSSNLGIISNSPPRQKLHENARPYKPSFNFDQEYSRPKRQKKPLQTSAKFSFDYESDKHSRPFKKV